MLDDFALVRSLADRGQEFFAARVSGLSDEQWAGPSGLPGWSRAHVVAHVGLNAYALAKLASWATTGVETRAYSSPAQRDADIDAYSTRSPAELRSFTDQGIEHITMAWEAVSNWSFPVQLRQGTPLPVSETVWLRAREAWIHAIDLADGTSFEDAPAEFLDGLIDDVRSTWARNGVVLTLGVTDREHAPGDISGTAAALLGWATGRSVVGVSAEGPLPEAPPWM
jgi:maleylpyruvate isomerase